MGSFRPHYYLNFLGKKFNCIFILNQVCHVNFIMMSLYSSGSSTNTLFQKLFLHETSASNPTSLPHARKISVFKERCQNRTLFSQTRAVRYPKERVDTKTSTEVLSSQLKPLGAHRMSTVRPSTSHMVWVDCEMTGLDPAQHSIMEVAAIVTDADLNVMDQVEIVLHKTEEDLKTMNEWCIKTHTASGLVAKVRQSSISAAQADQMLFEFVSKHVSACAAPLAGNSVYMDRIFILKEFPKFNKHLHYRIIDVSSLKELCKMYRPQLYKKVPQKRLRHRGLEDIEDTIEEFKFYKAHFLRATDNPGLQEFSTAVPYC